jgi:hypothetical protein
MEENMARTKVLDSIISQAEVESGLASQVVKTILQANRSLNDFDDACQAAGKQMGEYFLHLCETSEIFKKEVKAALGADKFNEEFFLDGIREAITEEFGGPGIGAF